MLKVKILSWIMFSTFSLLFFLNLNFWLSFSLYCNVFWRCMRLWSSSIASTTVEANRFVLFHGVSFSGNGWNWLDEADHCLSTVGIKGIESVGVQFDKWLLSIVNWIFVDCWFNIISEVWYKSQSVIQLHFESLIINDCPFPTDHFSIGFIAILAGSAIVCFSFRPFL